MSFHFGLSHWKEYAAFINRSESFSTPQWFQAQLGKLNIIKAQGKGCTFLKKKKRERARERESGAAKELATGADTLPCVFSKACLDTEHPQSGSEEGEGWERDREAGSRGSHYRDTTQASTLRYVLCGHVCRHFMKPLSLTIE